MTARIETKAHDRNLILGPIVLLPGLLPDDEVPVAVRGDLGDGLLPRVDIGREDDRVGALRYSVLVDPRGEDVRGAIGGVDVLVRDPHDDVGTPVGGHRWRAIPLRTADGNRSVEVEVGAGNRGTARPRRGRRKGQDEEDETQNPKRPRRRTQDHVDASHRPTNRP